ncbi:AcrR family transcriptional regulator [Kutzneria viridogrisea]|uniref:AcrR family transcriptional regulator n=1 Tax=Kutzneria viridogrisea TaxID=47990 RepID=A0ABR6BUP6_9PSEU|nr:AcrR family transcriptional regulator [Kutzneria viridogrisea]
MLAELVERGYARLSMEGVAKRAGSGKSALYRRWRTKQEMVLAVLAGIGVPMADVADTGTLRGDLHATVVAVAEWLTEPPFSRIVPDLVAEATRTPELAEGIARTMRTRWSTGGWWCARPRSSRTTSTGSPTPCCAHWVRRPPEAP